MRTASALLVFLWGIPLCWAGFPDITHEFAQVGAGGGIRSVVLVLSQSSEDATITLRLFDDDGNPLSLMINGALASQFEGQVVAGGSTRIEITSGGAATAGSARLTASRPVGAQLLFEISVGQELVTQAAVEALSPLDSGEIFVDTTAGQTGLAIANVSDTSPILIRLTLKNEAGTVVSTHDLQLPARGHLAAFVIDLFGEQANSLRGSLQIVSTGSIALVTLQQTGLILGTLPVVIPLP